MKPRKLLLLGDINFNNIGLRRPITNYHFEKSCIVHLSNQPVEQGVKTLAEALEDKEKLFLQIPSTSILICPDLQGLYCWFLPGNNNAKPVHLSWASQWQGQFKKPDPGMIYAALLNHTGVTWESSLMIGNRDDQQAAARAEIKFIQALI